jgi:hypothetical protein
MQMFSSLYRYLNLATVEKQLEGQPANGDNLKTDYSVGTANIDTTVIQT